MTSVPTTRRSPGRWLGAAVVILGCAAPERPASTEAVERAALALLDSLAAAVSARDVARLGALMSDAQYIGAGLVIEPGRFREVAGPAFDELDSIHQRWEERAVRPVAPRATIVTARATTSSTTGGDDAVEHGLYTFVVAQRDDGSWRIVNAHKTTLPTP